MRFLVIVKASKDSEAGVTPSQELLTAMGKYNEELRKAGVILAGEGLHPSSKGKRVRFAGDSRVMLFDEMPEWGALGPQSLKGSPVTLHLFVEDVDAFVARAVAAGAKVTMAVAYIFWGDRYGKIEGPFGHHWSVATHSRDVSLQELRQGAQKMCS